jgi:hypothetical protein
MDALLNYLRDNAITLTVYNCDESDERLDQVGGRLAGGGIALRTDDTATGRPRNVGVFHRDDEVIDAVSFDDLAEAEADFEAILGGATVERPDLPVEQESPVSVSPETSRQRMIGISRRFERRALAEGEGQLHAGFQNLSVLAGSERARSVYERLAGTNLDVTVYGYPDADLGDVPYEVVADEDGVFREFWFLLYDGGGNDDRKAALVSREQEPSLYDSFWTVDPETVDRLFDLARKHYPLLS